MGLLILCFSSCSAQPGADQKEVPPERTSPSENQPGDANAPKMLEAVSGPLTARIFSSQETTINQRKFDLEGWTNRASVISVNDIIITASAEDPFSVELSLEAGSNLIEVVVSDYEGNEVRFELVVFVE